MIPLQVAESGGMFVQSCPPKTAIGLLEVIVVPVKSAGAPRLQFSSPKQEELRNWYVCPAFKLIV
jgi:hypothetical protein